MYNLLESPGSTPYRSRRHGKPVARLVFEPSADPTAQQWLERLRRLHHEASHGAV